MDYDMEIGTLYLLRNYLDGGVNSRYHNLAIYLSFKLKLVSLNSINNFPSFFLYEHSPIYSGF